MQTCKKIEIGSGQKGLEKDEFLGTRDKGVSSDKNHDMEVVPETLDLFIHR